MFLLKLLVAILLIAFIQQVTGIETCGDENYGKSQCSCSVQNTFNNESITSNGTSTDLNQGVCTNGHYHSFTQTLTALTSNGLINITTDVMLCLIIQLASLENISIIGHNNPTVNCGNAGGIYFNSCLNCTIKGITWESYGTKNGSIAKPGIELYKSSNVIIQNYSFKHSVTQAISLSEVSGNINIEHCKFFNNSNCEGHGAAIYYNSSNTNHYITFHFTISHCNFSHNRGTNSIVFIGPSNNDSNEQTAAVIKNLVFLNNYGTPLYISRQILYINEKILFSENLAEKGGGIFITNHSNIIFHHSIVKLDSNNITQDGGTLYIEDHSNATFKETPW